MSKLHSFGGSALDRHVFEFETTETGDEMSVVAGLSDTGGDGQPGGEAGAALSPEAPAEGETDPSAVATDAAPAWTPEQIAQLREMPEFRDFVAEEASTIADARLNAYLQQQQQYGQQQPDGAQEFDNGFDPNEFLNPLSDNFGVNLLNVLQAFNDQAQAPYREQAAQEQQRESNERINDIISDTITRNGDLAGDNINDRIRERAREILPSVAQRYGASDRAAEIAIEQAYRDEKSYQDKVGAAAVERFKNHAATLGGAPHDPAGGAAGVTALVTDGDEMAVARKYAGLAR